MRYAEKNWKRGPCSDIRAGMLVSEGIRDIWTLPFVG